MNDEQLGAALRRLVENVEKPKKQRPINVERPRKTFNLRMETIELLERVAEQYGVGLGQLADFALYVGLREIEAGRVKLPIREEHHVYRSIEIEG